MFEGLDFGFETDYSLLHCPRTGAVHEETNIAANTLFTSVSTVLIFYFSVYFLSFWGTNDRYLPFLKQ